MAYQSEREEIENKKFVDYKDVAYLRQFMNPHAKMLPKKRTGVQADKQRQNLASESMGDATVTYLDQAMPKEVVELLKPYTRPCGL